MVGDAPGYVGFARFEALKPRDDVERMKWEIARRIAHEGSFRHFLSALAQNRLRQVRFSISWSPRSSAANGLLGRRGRAVDIDDILTATERPYEKMLSSDGYLQVSYQREAPESGYMDFLARQLASKWSLLLSRITPGNPPRVANPRIQVSLIRTDGIPVLTNTSGDVADPLVIQRSGYWSYERAAELLPLDYASIKRQAPCACRGVRALRSAANFSEIYTYSLTMPPCRRITQSCNSGTP